MKKIDVRPILVEHVRTLRDQRFGQRVSIVDLLTFFGIPALVAVPLVAVRFGFRTDAVNGILNAFSIFTGLLLNLLVLVFTLASATAPTNLDAQKRKELLLQVFANVCFSLLTAIAVVCVAVITLGYMKSAPGAQSGPLTTCLITYLTLNFVLTLLMVIKRMYVLLRKDMDRSARSSAA